MMIKDKCKNFIIFIFILYSIFFVKKVQKRNMNLLVSLIPLYYGFFISFATYAEFMRLMIPVVPSIIYNFMFTKHTNLGLLTMLWLKWSRKMTSFWKTGQSWCQLWHLRGSRMNMVFIFWGKTIWTFLLMKDKDGWRLI